MKTFAYLAMLLTPCGLLAQTLGCPGSAAYYVNTSSGSDSNAGTSASPWKTGAQAAAQQSASQIAPGSNIYVTSSTPMRESWPIINSTVPTSSTTTPSVLPASGTTACPITWIANGTVVNSALDIEPAHTWTSDGSGVYHATFTTHPGKIMYPDKGDVDGPQLLPVLNGAATTTAGMYSGTATYNEYDMSLIPTYSITETTPGSGMPSGTYPITFTGQAPSGCITGSGNVTGSTVVLYSVTTTGCTTPPTGASITTGGTSPVIAPNAFQNLYMISPNNFNVTGVSPTSGFPWTPVSNNIQPNDSQSFPTTGTGIQNVTATPGSWWITPSGSNWTVYIHLPDGTSPAGHVIEATHRDYNVLLQSVDNVIFRGFTFEGAMKQGVYILAAADSSLGGNYWTGEGNRVIDSKYFNYANAGTIKDAVNSAYSSRSNLMMCGMLVRPGVENDPHFIRLLYPISEHNDYGTADAYYGLRGEANTFTASLCGEGIDGVAFGIPSSRRVPFSWRDTFHPHNTSSIIYNPNALSLTQGQRNHGGRIAYATITNSVTGITPATDQTASLDHNFCHDMRGQCFQLGGQSTANDQNPFLVFSNVFAQTNQAPHGQGFNAIDCNGNGPGYGGAGTYFAPKIFNNTLYNTALSGATFEDTCPDSFFHANIVDQNALVVLPGTINPPTAAGVAGYLSPVGQNNATAMYFFENTSATQTITGTTSAGSNLITAATGTAGPFYSISGPGIPIKNYVLLVSGTTLTMALPSTASGTVSLTAKYTSHTPGVDWADNSYAFYCSSSTPAAGCHGGSFSSGYANCATFATLWPDGGNHLCEDKPPQFVDAQGSTSCTSTTCTNDSHNNFHLVAGSPQINGAAVFTIDGVTSDPTMGGVPDGSVFPYVAGPYVPPSSVIYQVVHNIYPAWKKIEDRILVMYADGGAQ